VVGGLGLAAEVSLDSLLASGVLGGDVQDLPHCARGLVAEHRTNASHVVSQMKALIASASVTLGSSLCFLEKR
jgi:hypothetical protein